MHILYGRANGADINTTISMKKFISRGTMKNRSDIPELYKLCGECGCYDLIDMSDKQWNTRPIEDALQSEIARLTAENTELREANMWVSVDDRLPEYIDQWVVYLCLVDWFGEIHIAPLAFVYGKWYISGSVFNNVEWTKHVLAWKEMPKVKSGDFAKKIFSNKQSDIIASNS